MWQFVSLPFTADSTGSVAVHLVSIGNGQIYWDDVSVVQAVPISNYGLEASVTLSPKVGFGGTNAAISSTAAHSGTYSISMSTGGGGVVQTIPSLIPGQQYVVSAWVNVAAGNVAELWVDDSSSATTEQMATQGATNGMWQFVSLPFTVDSTSRMSVHLASVGAGLIYWDDVSVVQAVPVSNYGLETGDLSSRQAFGGTNATISSAAAHSGSYSISMSTGGGGVVQTISNLTSAQQYVVSAWVNVAAGNVAELWVDDSSSATTEQMATQGATNGMWQFVSLPFTVDSTGRMSVHLASVGAGLIYWDDVSVVQAVPVSNYGLETGDLSSWQAFGDTNATISSAAAHSGSYSISMSTGGGGVVQTISNLTSAQEYVVSAWVNVAAGNVAELWVDDSSSATGAQMATQGATNGTWQLVSSPFTADSTGRIAVHLVSIGNGQIYWDNVSVIREVGPVTISGQATNGGAGLSGVTVTLTGTTADGTSGSQTTTTDSNGNYSFSFPAGGSYTVTPSRSNATFILTSQNFGNLAADQVANFFLSTEVTSGSAAPDVNPTPAPVATPLAVVSGSVNNCNGISGTWTDNTALQNTYSLNQVGSSVAGSVTTYQAGCGSFNGTIQGQMNGPGSFTLTATSPAHDACGYPITSTQATENVTISGCSAAQVSISPGSGASGFLGSGGGGHSGTVIWSRDSDPPGLSVTLDLMAGTIKASLSGQAKTANLSSTINGAGQSTSLPSHANAEAGNSFTDSLQRTMLPAGQYGSLVAVWDDLTLTLPLSFNVLGNYRFSTYNTSYETQCGPSTAPAVIAYNYSGDTCTWKTENLNPAFMSQVNINGTGVNASGEILKTWAVNQACRLPVSALTKGTNAYYLVPKIDGECLSEFNQTAPTAIAVSADPRFSPGVLACSDQALMVDSGNATKAIKTVQDKCPACSGDFRGTQGHIDTYTNSHACFAHDPSIQDQGNFTAIRSR